VCCGSDDCHAAKLKGQKCAGGFSETLPMWAAAAIIATLRESRDRNRKREVSKRHCPCGLRQR
jgi:hypothetical protein